MTCVTDERRAAAAVAQIPTRRAAAAVAQTLLRDQLASCARRRCAGFVLRTNGEWAGIYFPDVNRTDWRRASGYTIIPHEELKAIQYPTGHIRLRRT